MMTEASNPLGEVVAFNFGSMVGIANYFVPLDFIFGSVSSLLSLWLVAIAYRFVKSWVPTAS